MKKINILYLESYDEEWEERFLDRVAEEIKKVLLDNKVSLSNDTVQVTVDLLREKPHETK